MTSGTEVSGVRVSFRDARSIRYFTPYLRARALSSRSRVAASSRTTAVASTGSAPAPTRPRASHGARVTREVCRNRFTLPDDVRRILEMVGALAGAIVIAAMVVVAINAAIHSFRTGEYRMGIAHVVVWPARAAVAVGLFLYFIEFVTGAIRRFRDPDAHEPDERELAERGLLP